MRIPDKSKLKNIVDWACKNNKQGNTFVSVAADMNLKFPAINFASAIYLSIETGLDLHKRGELILMTNACFGLRCLCCFTPDFGFTQCWYIINFVKRESQIYCISQSSQGFSHFLTKRLASSSTFSHYWYYDSYLTYFPILQRWSLLLILLS